MLKELVDNKRALNLIKKYIKGEISKEEFVEEIYPWAIVDYIEFAEDDGTNLSVGFDYNSRGNIIYIFTMSNSGTTTNNMVTYRNIKSFLKSEKFKINKYKLKKDFQTLIAL